MPFLVIALALLVTKPAPQPTPADAASRAGAVIASFAAQDFAKIEAQFTDQMKAAMPPGRLAGTWQSLLTRAGAFQSCAPDPRIRSIDDKRMVITACAFERASLDLQIAFDPEGRIAGLAFRPAASPGVPYGMPSYADPGTYTEESMTVGLAEWALPATLTIPVGAGPFPAVVLVHGSGPNDRDETVGANKPFRDLAVGLASRGVAVLRYDKRSKVHGPRMAALPGMTVKEEVVDDAGAAIGQLRGTARIDGARVFVLGHSLGGMLVPRIAAANPSLAGAIVLAGAARSLEDAIVEQTRYLAMLDGTISADEQTQVDAAAKMAAAVKALGAVDATAGRMVSGAPASYWLDLRGYDPPAAAAALKIPLLILQGERDYQVTMAEFAKWKAALGTRSAVTFRSYPALNHLFMAGTGAGSPLEYRTPSHVAEDVIRDIAAFIRR